MTNRPAGDRSRHPATHRRLEVVKPMTDARDGETRTPEQIAELFAVAGREIEAIKQLTGCVAQLHESAGREGSAGDPDPAEVRAALEFRRCALGEDQ